jgi:uncharacterized protein YjbJ (UPF0337 family)
MMRMKPMKASTKTRAEGKLREVEIALKEAVGEAARNRRAKKAGGVQGAVGHLGKTLGK